MLPNRIALYLTIAGGLATALAGPVANLDTTSTATLIGGFLGIAAIVQKWLDGWQKYEERTDLEALTAEQLKPPEDPASRKLR